MCALRFASFGVRGFTGESLSPRVIIDYASAFGTFVEGQTVLLGRDTRASSNMLHSATLSGLLSCGCEVLDLGVCPMPMLQFEVSRRNAAGAIAISGGHNNMGWNALTLIGPDGSVLDPRGGRSVLDNYHSGDFDYKNWSEIGQQKEVTGFDAGYLDALESFLKADAIRAAGFKVLIDPVGGAGCGFIHGFADRLGLDLVPLNAEPSGYLARDPEPRPRTARPLASIINYVQGDIGFVLSSDMVRLSVVSEKGEPASEEFTFPLIANHLLKRKAGLVIANTCTSRMIDDIAAKFDVPIVRTRVGQAYVVSRLLYEDGIIGGEGNGSICVPAFSRACDGFLSMGLILEAMAEEGCSLSELLAELPKYHIVKRSLACQDRDAYHAIERFHRRYLGDESVVEISLTDGVRIDWEDGWLHARSSRTEQIVRVISESENPELAEQRCDEAMRIFNSEIF